MKANLTWILETLTPLQIGSGADLFPDLDFVSVDGRPFVVDQNATFDALAVSDISLKNLGKLPSIVEDVHRQFGEYFGYVLTPLSPLPQANKEIREQVKDSFARPYLPGSSLKGAIRTALFAEFLRNTPKQKWEKKLPLKKGGKANVGPKIAALKLTQACFSANAPWKKEPNYDTMRLWKIGDANFAQNDLRLADVRFLNITHNGLQWKDFSGKGNLHDWKQSQGVLAEALQPGATTLFDVTIDDFLLDDPNAKRTLKWQNVPRNFAELREILNAHALFRIKREGEFYQKHGAAASGIYADLWQKMDKDKDAIYLQLGWGSGWRGMTGDWMDEPTENEMRELYRLRANNPEFPKTRRLVVNENGPVLPFGWVRLWSAEEYPELYRETEAVSREKKLQHSENLRRIRQIITNKKEQTVQAQKQQEEERKQAEDQAEQERLENEQRLQRLNNMSPLERLLEELREAPDYKGQFGKLDEFEGENKRRLAEFFRKRFVEDGDWEVKPAKKKQFQKIQKLKQILEK
ncbi:MAG: type III-A CRISPR-associated RAMP protein Csm5 [Candidatus Thioglobus sp.]|nr:type III-A CRISPR-associated RAMP protein Csm5 [Candidatus Thioglobus sp.]